MYSLPQSVSANMENSKKRTNSQVEPKAVAPVSGEENNPTLATYTRSLRRRWRTVDKCSTFSHIPREIIYHILSLVPASALQKHVRFVCKDWNSIISDPLFIKAHLVHSLSSPATTGFLFQSDDHATLKQAFYVNRYDHAMFKLPFQANILGSCNGLLLLDTTFTPPELFVANLVTKSIISLPALTLAGVCASTHSTALAFVPSSGQYKVFYISYVYKDKRATYVNRVGMSYFWNKYEFKVMACTIGVDKTWRAIDCQGITMSNDVRETLLSRPLSSLGGYLCWFRKHHNYGFALDTDAETMFLFTGPYTDSITATGCTLNFYQTLCIPMDTGVCVLHLQSPSMVWKIWEMIEPKTGTWGRCINFDAACMYSVIKVHFHGRSTGVAIPLFISLETGELWLLCGVVSRNGRKFVLVCYNWKNGSICSSPDRWPSQSTISPLPHLHVNSLLSPKNL